MIAKRAGKGPATEAGGRPAAARHPGLRPLPALCAVFALLALACLPVAARADALLLPPGAELQHEQATPLGSYPMPVGPHGPEGIRMRPLEGAVTRQAWRLPGTDLTTLQILAPLRAQLRDAGYEMLFTCETAGCGGFDFRFGTQVIGAPDMYVDLGDFRYLAARQGAEGDATARHVTLLVSRSRNAGFVQIVRTEPATGDPAPAAPGAEPGEEAEAPATDTTLAAAAVPSDIAAALAGQGRAVLGGLTFDSGAARLATGDYPVLDALAGWLAEDPARRIALVGHTDATGALDPNVALSRRRAQAVRERLLSDHGVPAAQVSAEGMGFLAPLASNATAAGREANRRVEAILLAPFDPE